MGDISCGRGWSIEAPPLGPLFESPSSREAVGEGLIAGLAASCDTGPGVCCVIEGCWASKSGRPRCAISEIAVT